MVPVASSITSGRSLTGNCRGGGHLIGFTAVMAIATAALYQEIIVRQVLHIRPSFQALPSNSTWPKRNWSSERRVTLSKPTQLMSETKLTFKIRLLFLKASFFLLQHVTSNTLSVCLHSWPSSVLGSIYSLRDGCRESQGTAFTVSGRKALYSCKVLAWPVYCKPLVGESGQVGAQGLAWNPKGQRLGFHLKCFPSWS